MNAKVEGDLKVQGKVVDADEMLRPRLKATSQVRPAAHFWPTDLSSGALTKH